jgi:hypothetical protein
MSFKEKRTISSIVTEVAVLAAYCIYAYGKAHLSSVKSGDLRSWAITMLIFIGIGIGVTIITQIVFSILISISVAIKEKIKNVDCDDKQIEKNIGVEMTEDEMDKLIELKSARFSFFFSGFGVIAALLSVLLNYSPVVMLNIIFISFSASSLIQGFTQLYFYRRGI